MHNRKQIEKKIWKAKPYGCDFVPTLLNQVKRPSSLADEQWSISQTPLSYSFSFYMPSYLSFSACSADLNLSRLKFGFVSDSLTIIHSSWTSSRLSSAIRPTNQLKCLLWNISCPPSRTVGRGLRVHTWKDSVHRQTHSPHSKHPQLSQGKPRLFPRIPHNIRIPYRNTSTRGILNIL